MLLLVWSSTRSQIRAAGFTRSYRGGTKISGLFCFSLPLYLFILPSLLLPGGLTTPTVASQHQPKWTVSPYLTCNMSTTCYLWDLGAIAICCALCQLPTICLGFNQSFLRGNQKIWTRSSRVYQHEEHRVQVEKGENHTRHFILGNCFSCLSETSLELIRSLKIRLARSSANCPWINTENKEKPLQL